jgi:hypothetical protein
MTDIGTGFGGPTPDNATTFNPIAAITFPIGTPVTGIAPPGAFNEVIPASATLNPGNTQFVLGLATIPGNAGQHVNVKYLGPLDLTAAQWDLITGQIGGLTPGQQYYLSPTPGRIQLTPALVRTVVGRAMSPTTFFIQPSA